MAIGTTAAILGAAAIGGGTALASGAMQSKAANKSAQAIAGASDQSAATQKYIFDTTRQDNALGRAAGNAALTQMTGLLGLGQVGTGQYGQAQAVPANALNPTQVLRSTPGYQFSFDEGMRALNLQAGNRGQLQSGGASREAIRYGQNMGDQNYGNYWNRLAGVAGVGQTANSANQAAGTNYANALTGINADRANGLASSYQNGANAWTNALGGAAGAGMWALGKF